MQKDMAVSVTLEGVDKLNPKLKEAIGRVNEITSRAKAARDQLKNIAITQNQIKGFEKLRTEAVNSGRALSQAREKAKELGDLTRRSAFAIEPYKKAVAEVKRLAESHDRLMQKTKAAKEALAAKGVTTDKLSAQTKRLREESDRLIKTHDRMAKDAERLQAAQNRASAMRSRAGTMAGVGVGMMAPGYAITRGLGGAVGEASELNSQLRQISITGDMTDERMDALRRTIIRTSAVTGQSTSALVESTGFMIAAGSTLDAAERSQMAIGKTAAAYKADMLEIAQTSFVLTDALGILPEKLQGSLGIMAKAGKEGNVELRDMAKLIPTLSSSMVALKVNGNEAVATIAAGLQIARKGAASSDEAGNNMKNFLTKVMSPDTLKKAQDKFGLDLYGVITKAQKSGNNPVEAALDAISRVTKGGDQKLLGDLFQDMQVQSFLRPMLQNMDEYRRIKAEALGAASGSMIDEDFARVARDMDVGTKRMGNAWENLKFMVGNALAPALVPVISMLTRATVALVEFTDRHPKLTSFLAILAGILGVVLLAGGGVALMIAGILLPMAALTMLAGTLGIALTPILLILAGIAAAVAGVVAVFVYWDEIVGYFMGKWEALKTELSTVGAFFMTVGRAILDGLIKPIIEGGVQVVNAILGVVSRGVDAVKAFLGIRSPSRVFAEIGGHTTAGLALGINRGAPAAVESVRRMAAGITVAGAATLSAGMAMAGPSAPGMPGGGSGGGVNIGPVSIVINGAGMSADEIALAIDKRMRAMATQAKTEQQARFFDD